MAQLDAAHALCKVAHELEDHASSPLPERPGRDRAAPSVRYSDYFAGKVRCPCSYVVIYQPFAGTGG